MEKHPKESERIKNQQVKDKGKVGNVLLQKDKMRLPWLLCDLHAGFLTFF